MSVFKPIPGTLRVDETGAVWVNAQPSPKNPPKEYRVAADLLRPKGLTAQQLNGANATVQWNVGEGRVGAVEVILPEDRPIPLANEKDGFLNPYAFISIPDRAGLPEELKDDEPAGHDRYQKDRWAGSITVTITTRTPLLIPDHARAAADAGALPARLDHKNRPVLAGSAVKGMLRSAYEAITNSRFGVFTGHDQQLAIRAQADKHIGENLRPAFVNPDGETLTVVKALVPTASTLADGKKPVQTAVWVPKRLVDNAERGQLIEAWLHLAQLGPFPLWRLAAWAKPGQLGEEPPQSPPRQQKGTQAKPVPSYPPVRVLGRVHRTDSSFPAGGTKKHSERMVVEQILSGPARLETDDIRLTKAMRDGWRAVIDSYARAHERESNKSIYGTYVSDPDRWRDLKPGDTLYVKLEGKKVIGLYPAMIGRVPFPGPPVVSLPEAHRPATDRARLSPADRVFGWVAQGSNDDGVAHRGHLRVLPPDEEGIPDKGSVVTFPAPLALTTLNGPKPAQFLFYLGGPGGAPLTHDQREKEANNGYPSKPGERQLRGRKVYLTHGEVLSGQPGADEYWSWDSEPKQAAVDGRTRYREFVAHPKSKTQVGTSVSGWVKPGTTFTVTLQVDNLTNTELGALLWLLALPEGATHKLGLGKPLGFGAVRLDIDWTRTRLVTGDPLLDRYRMLSLSAEASPLSDATALIGEYDALLRGVLSGVRTEFLNAARGMVGAPVHYPRVLQGQRQPGVPPAPQATTYEWWVANDRVGSGQRCAMNELSDPNSLLLPYHEKKPDGKSGPHRPDEDDTGSGHRPPRRP